MLAAMLAHAQTPYRAAPGACRAAARDASVAPRPRHRARRCSTACRGVNDEAITQYEVAEQRRTVLMQMPRRR